MKIIIIIINRGFPNLSRSQGAHAKKHKQANMQFNSKEPYAMQQPKSFPFLLN